MNVSILLTYFPICCEKHSGSTTLLQEFFTANMGSMIEDIVLDSNYLA